MIRFLIIIIETNLSLILLAVLVAKMFLNYSSIINEKLLLFYL